MNSKGNHRDTEAQSKHRELFSVPLCLCGCISMLLAAI